MPTKESKSKVEKEPKKATTAKKSTASKKTSTLKAETEKKTTKKATSKKADESKATAVKKTATKKATEPKASAVKKATTKKTAEPKVSTVKKVTAKKATTPKTSTVKKTATKKADESKVSSTKKVTAKKTTKSTSSTVKKTTTKKSASKEDVKPKTTKTSSKKKTTSSTKKTTKTKKAEKIIQILEYYDLPYRYNETTVKILAQTPNILFVYWDISDDDRNNLIKQNGEYFFNDTYPVLVVHNKTKNYSVEVPINDFANSWYLELEDPNCEYNIELGRRYKEYAYRNPEIEIPTGNYFYLTDSNDLVMPNDHVLFENVKPEVQYRNVKSGDNFTVTISEILLENSLAPIRSLQELYQNIYQMEEINLPFFDLKNPGSGNPSSNFR